MVLNITEADESYTHQLPVPFGESLYPEPRAWGDRCYMNVWTETGLMVNSGRQLYAHGGLRRAMLGVSDGTTQYSAIEQEPFTPGRDDPDEPQIGKIRIECVEPLKKHRIILEEDPNFPIAADLTWRSRFPVPSTVRYEIRQQNRFVTDYINYYQPGIFDGTVVVDGTEHVIKNRYGFRDRGWGLRKHEGSARRGLLIYNFAEFEDMSFYFILFESSTQKQKFLEGWVYDETGIPEQVVKLDHEITFRDGRIVDSAEFNVKLSSGQDVPFTIKSQTPLLLKTLTYTADEVKAGRWIHDLSDPAVVAELDGENEYGSTFTFGDRKGYGFFETSLGYHTKYRPDAFVPDHIARGGPVLG